jgi:hypothetical protein
MRESTVDFLLRTVEASWVRTILVQTQQNQDTLVSLFYIHYV